MAKIERESVNFKLPKDLTAALRAKAEVEETTATALVIQGLSLLGIQTELQTDRKGASINSHLHRLEEKLSQVDESVESRLHRLEESLSQVDESVESRLHQLETKLGKSIA